MKKKKIRIILNDRISWWIHWLGIGFWDITVVFSNKKRRKPDGSYLCGKTHVSWKYMTAHIVFYLPCLKYQNPEALEKIVIHELMHIMVNEMRDFLQDANHEERVATGLQKAFAWVVGETKRNREKHEPKNV